LCDLIFFAFAICLSSYWRLLSHLENWCHWRQLFAHALAILSRSYRSNDIHIFFLWRLWGHLQISQWSLRHNFFFG
jgi:hypothetical protein